jgi:drug/metabolite transporter (DMT)-like permease
MIIFHRILVRLDAGQIMISNYLQPFFGVLMAAMLLEKELVGLTIILGGLLVIGETVLSNI